MMDLVRHRGPDAEGIAVCASAVLGHRRLAILDLSEAARQPMTNETGSVTVVFNGEIYNCRELQRELRNAGHQFISSSDTEVIVHGYEQWGMKALLGRLRGMFAFALHDAEQVETGGAFFFLARDRLGIKPLYIANQNGRVLFASEVRALRGSGLMSEAPDTDGLIGLLCLGSVPSPRTYLKDVRSLPPGHFISISRFSVETERYWKLHYDSPAGGKMSEILSDAIGLHLLSDVPLGAFLSGGLDSGGLVALASRKSASPLRTLTATFEERQLDESAGARQVAQLFGTNHQEVRITEREFLDEIEKFLRVMDQPTADGVNTYFICRAARAQGLTVVLSGLGGDEVFLGYSHYRLLAGLMPWRRRCNWLAGPLHNCMRFGGNAWGRIRGEERWRRFAYLQRRSAAEGLYLVLRGFFAPEQVCSLLGVTAQRVDDALEESFAAIREEQTEDGELDGFHRIEMQRYLHDQLLRDSDVFSMAHSLELRVPYLDHEVVEQGCRIPARARISRTVNKPQLVEAVHEPFLAEASRKKKQGFTFPMAAWMRAHGCELSRMAARSSWLDPSAVRQCWKQFEAGRMHWSRAWATLAVASRN
jgi:asparagine synthase (glutamine-hydrolysing)